MMAFANNRGTQGEDFACACLQKDGYEILERNWRSGHSEIDLIAQKEKIIAFIEVKTRCENAYLTPLQSLSRAQRRRIILAGVEYLRKRGIYNTQEYQPRFDLFGIVTEKEGSSRIVQYYHIKGAYGTEGLNVFV